MFRIQPQVPSHIIVERHYVPTELYRTMYGPPQREPQLPSPLFAVPTALDILLNNIPNTVLPQHHGINLDELQRNSTIEIVPVGSILSCSICLDAISEGEISRRLDACRHIFHIGCIDRWLTTNTSCPVCRNSIIMETAT